MCQKHNPTRRDFIKAAGLAVGAPYVITTAALGKNGRPAASERIVLAGIGTGDRGRTDQNAFLGLPDVQYVAVCDVKAGDRNAAKGQADNRYKNSDCKMVADFRDILSLDDIDAVHIATPDHWHAYITVAACRAGKDVFCEKPETLTLDDGPKMINAARRYSRVVCGGSQRVREDYNDMVNACWDGTLGKIKSINVEFKLGLLDDPNLPAEQVPNGIDYNMWLGPAPWVPFNHARIVPFGDYCPGTCWRHCNDYSGGFATDWGAHYFGGAAFAADVMDKQPVRTVYHETKEGKFGTNYYLAHEFANGPTLYVNHPKMNLHQVVGTPGQKIPPKKQPNYKGQGGLYGDFIYCCKTREKPFRDIEYAVNTVVLCHMTIIAGRLHRSLQWDAKKNQFIGDDEANRMVARARRQPWVL
jgi:hypothetical protein